MMFKILSVLLTVFQIALVADQGISLANDYQKNSGLQWEWATESLKKFSFDPQDKVLDVGCGDGKITALIAAQVSDGMVMGMDISEKMIKQATISCQKENLMFFLGNAVAVPFKEQFDKVVSFCTLHWVLDQEQALQSMKECLKQNGTLLLVLPGKAPNNLATLSEKIIRSEKWAAHFPTFKQERVYFSVEEYRELLKKVNLEIKSIVETESITVYKNKAALIAWIKPLVNFIDHLSPQLQTSFIEEIANQMLLNDAPLGDGSIPIRHVKIEAIATK